MKSRGFSLIELVSVVVVVASVGAVLGPSVGKMRGQMRGVTSEGNLHTIGQVGAMYAMDHEDRIFSFTWRGEEEYLLLHNGQLRIPGDDITAAAWQVQNILQRATGRLSGLGRILNPQLRLMHRRYSHLVLADYMSGSVTDPMWADPADSNLLSWQLNPLEYIEDENTVPYGNGQPEEDGYDDDPNWASNAILQLWPFASSYQVVPHAWMRDFGDQYIPVSNTPHLFIPYPPGSDVPLGERRFHEVAWPSAKVHMFEEFDREQAGSPYFGYDHAQSAKLMFDGSINTMASGHARPSVSPEHFDYWKHHPFWEQRYIPLDTFPLPLGGLGDQTLLSQRFRWTAYGLQGLDYPQVLMRGNGR